MMSYNLNNNKTTPTNLNIIKQLRDTLSHTTSFPYNQLPQSLARLEKDKFLNPLVSKTYNATHYLTWSHKVSKLQSESSNGTILHRLYMK